MTTPIQPQQSAISTELRSIARLCQLVATIAPEPDKILPGELRDGIDVIRRDLLGDAIDTDAALKRYREARKLVERVAALQEGGAKRELMKRPETVAKVPDGALQPTRPEGHGRSLPGRARPSDHRQRDLPRHARARSRRATSHLARGTAGNFYATTILTSTNDGQ